MSSEDVGRILGLIEAAACRAGRAGADADAVRAAVERGFEQGAEALRRSEDALGLLAAVEQARAAGTSGEALRRIVEQRRAPADAYSPTT